MTRTAWTPEQDAFLRKNYGPMTATQIAGHYGVSRNAVIGRAKRIGLCQPAAEAKIRRRVMPKQARVPSVAEAKREAARIAREAKAQAKAAREEGKAPSAEPRLFDLSKCKPLVELRPFSKFQANECRFPVAGASDETLFCSAETEEGASYCVDCRGPLFTRKGSGNAGLYKKGADYLARFVTQAERQGNRWWMERHYA